MKPDGVDRRRAGGDGVMLNDAENCMRPKVTFRRAVEALLPSYLTTVADRGLAIGSTSLIKWGLLANGEAGPYSAQSEKWKDPPGQNVCQKWGTLPELGSAPKPPRATGHATAQHRGAPPLSAGQVSGPR